MKEAAIDIGTNTCLLLIAEIDKERREIKPLLSLQRIPRLGRGVDSAKKLSEESIQRLLQVLEEYKLIISQHGVSKTYLTATSAARDSTNKSELIQNIKNELGWDLEIIAGDTEAELTFSGGLYNLDIPDSQDIGLLDIGGGSTEIVLGSMQEGVQQKYSFDMGCVRYTERFLRNDSLSETEIERTFHAVRAELKEWWADSFVSTIVAVAGTATSLAAMHQGLKSWVPEKVHGYRLQRDTVRSFIRELLNMKKSQLLAAYPVFMEGRSDIFHAGLIILDCFIEMSNAEEVLISIGGIREGVLKNPLLLEASK